MRLMALILLCSTAPIFGQLLRDTQNLGDIALLTLLEALDATILSELDFPTVRLHFSLLKSYLTASVGNANASAV